MLDNPPRTVRLELPAEASFVRLARLTAAGLATELSYTIEEIEDVRVAIDELYFLLVDGASHSLTAHICYTILPSGLRVDGKISAPGITEPLIEPLVKEILNVTTDEWGFDEADGDRSFYLVKNRISTSS